MPGDVPRKPKTPRPGEGIHISFVVDGTIVQAADEEAARLSKDLHLKVTRSDVLRRWLAEAAAAAAKKSRK